MTGRTSGARRPRAAIGRFATFLAKERNDSPHTVSAYRRDLEALADFLDQYHGGAGWNWEGIVLLTLRAFMGHLHERWLAKPSICRAV